MKNKKKIVILGAGVSGLATAYRLSKTKNYEIHVIDKASQVGGLCGSFREGEFILDYGPHKFYSLLDGVLDELQDMMGDDLLVRNKVQSLFMFGRYFAFPLKMGEMLTRFPASQSVKILVSFICQLILKCFGQKKAKTYEEFITQQFGATLFSTIFEPMARKTYGDPKLLDKKLAEVRISSPSLISVVKQLVFSKKIDRTISAPEFHYPKFGYGMIVERLREKSEQNGVEFHLGFDVKRINLENEKISEVLIGSKDSQVVRIPCDSVVYSIPIAIIGKLLGEQVDDLAQLCEKVRSRNTVIYYFLLKSDEVLPSMWVFYPECQFRFGRLSEMSKFSPHTVPKGHTALMVDFTCEDGDPVWSLDDDGLGDYLLEQLAPLRLFERDQIVKQFSKRFKGVYPVYDVGFEERLKGIRSLEARFTNLYFIGRQGDFNYNNADQCLDMGFRVADHISRLDGRVGVDQVIPKEEFYSENAAGESGKEKGLPNWITARENSVEDWQSLRSERFDQYRIVD